VDDGWPVVVRYQPGGDALTRWARGLLALDLTAVVATLPSDPEYGRRLGEALFRDKVRRAFVRAADDSATAGGRLRVLLIVEARDLRRLHWQQLQAPLDRGWDYLLLNQDTPFSLYLPTQIARRFPPIGRRDLRALILVAGPESLEGDYGLAPFDVAGTVRSVKAALAPIPADVLAREDAGVGDVSGPPTLDALCARLTAGRAQAPYTLLHIVCHGAYRGDLDETVLYFPQGEDQRLPVRATEMMTRLGRLEHLPHLALLSACESADPRAETGLGGAGQRLVRELGLPAVLAMTDLVSIETAGALSTAFYERLAAHGEVDLALSEALAGLQGQEDVTVPALLSRLGARPLWSDALDRPLTDAETAYGLEQMSDLVAERAPVLLPEFEAQAGSIQATLGSDPQALGTEARAARDNALAAINGLSSEALDLSFNALALGQAPPDYDKRCPFRGMYPFRADDRAFFFGREALVAQLVKQLREHGFLAIVGPSGSGKSSLVLAGMVPALEQVEPALHSVYLTPGSDPLAQLAAAWAAYELANGGGGEGISAADSQLAAPQPASNGNIDPDQAPLRCARPPVVVDQFEELFTLCDDEKARQAFVERLLALGSRASVLLTMRASFLGECARFPALKEAMQAHLALVAPLDAAGLRAAMEQQADVVGLRFEAGLGEEILDEVRDEPGAMPLLQHALLLLWNRRHGCWLRWTEYQAFGGITKAIAHTADEVYLDLAPEERGRMRDIFLRLTRLGDELSEGEVRDTRRRVAMSELVPAGDVDAPTVALVERLAGARLVVTSVNAANGQQEVEVAHEALIRHWPRLQDWLAEDRDLLRLREGIRSAVLDWNAHRRDEAYLVHRGGRLEDAEVLHRQGRLLLNRLEQHYLSACVEMREKRLREEETRRQWALNQARALAEEQRLRAEAQEQNARRLRHRAIILAGSLVVAAVLAVLAVLFWARAADQTQIARAREAAALAINQQDEHLDRALLLGVKGFQTKTLPQTHEALFEVWGHNSRLSRFLHGHGDEVTSVSWSVDGRLASGARDGSITIWELAEDDPSIASPSRAAQAQQGPGEEGSTEDDTLGAGPNQLAAGGGVETMALDGHQGAILSVAWSPDGRLASAGADGRILIWDPAEREPGTRGAEPEPPVQELAGHDGAVYSIAWSADGRLASGGEDGLVIVWNLETGQPGKTLAAHREAVRSVAWSSDGRLASGSGDETIRIWDPAQPDAEEPMLILEGHTSAVRSVAWSEDGRLASGSEDRTVRIWYLSGTGLVGALAELAQAEGTPVQILTRHASWVLSVAWSDDGRLASGSEDSTVLIWGSGLQSVAQQGTDVAGPLQDEPEQVLTGHSAGVTSIDWAPDLRLASASRDNSVIVWNLAQVGHAQQVPALTLWDHEDWIWGVAWSDDGRLASASEDGTVIVWDLSQPAMGGGYLNLTLGELATGITSVAWSSNGKLAAGTKDKRVAVWDLTAANPGEPSVAQMLEGHTGWVWTVAWSPDGRLASGSQDGTIKLWEFSGDGLAPEQPAQTLEAGDAWVTSVAWSYEGRLASGSGNGAVMLWDLNKGELEQTLEGHDEWVWSVAWSPDGRLASGSKDRGVIVWGMESGMPDQILREHATWVTSVAWSADGRLASASTDRTAIVWDLETSQPAQKLEGHVDWIRSVAWSGDGRLATGSEDATVQVWPMDAAVWAAQACERAGRDLSQDEWARLFPEERPQVVCGVWSEKE
jgi:WD40 repeat protein